MASMQRSKMAALGLVAWFDPIIYTDDWGREHWKPSVRAFEHALALVDVAPRQAMYVGDNPGKDFIGARRLGMATVRVVRPATEHGHRQADAGYEADYEIVTLDELPAICDRVFAKQEKD
jgi:putative hydrolase of the HAD superfamily